MDGRFVVVKFPENSQGELVLANEFMCCHLAEMFDLPVNRAVLVSVDERLLRLPRQNGQIPPNFSAGVRCGMIRFEESETCGADGIAQHCANSAELHLIAVFEQFVCRQDGRQMLMYPSEATPKRFAAIDYGFAFGGQPLWSAASLPSIAAPQLPANDQFTGQPYADGILMEPIIEKLRTATEDHITTCLAHLHAPRWGVTVDDLKSLAPFLRARAESLIGQFDVHHRPQQEIF